MITKLPTRVFITYSHDSKQFKEKVKLIGDNLRLRYNIDVFADFYDEDNPYGNLISDFMHTISELDKVLIILTPGYKKKADEGKGGVGYEGMLITSELYNNLGSQKFIPIIIDNVTTSSDDYFPQFLGPLRKGVFRNNFKDDDSFIEEIARAIENKPKSPKPPLGNSGWSASFEQEIKVESLNIDYLLQTENSRVLFDTAYNISRKEDTAGFNALKNEVVSSSFSFLLQRREEYEKSFSVKVENELPPIMDTFVDIIRPVFLISYAGYLSENAVFTRQEGIMYDLLSIDAWNNRSGNTYNIIQGIPEMLVYVYHHIYGALHIGNNRLSEITRLLKTKLPSPHQRNSYEYLYKMHSVSGWVDSLGRNCFNSFKFLLDSYNRWIWLQLLFRSEAEFKKNLVSYQLIIHILNYFDYLEENQFSKDIEFDIPPGFVIAESEYKSFAINLLMKESEYFKKYLQERKIAENVAIDKWAAWTAGMHRFRSVGYFSQYLPANFIKNLLM